MFIAFLGLYQDMNRTAESYGHGQRFHATVIKGVCIAWLVFGILLLLVGIAGIFDGGESESAAESMFLTLLNAIVTISMYWIIRNNVLEFIDIKSSVGR
jgi:hypothetical protein